MVRKKVALSQKLINMKNITLLVICILILVLLFRILPNSQMDLSCPNCNVIFVDIDLLRADYVGLLNNELGYTPNIDDFFENSIIFENAMSSSGLTSRSCISILTSTESVLNKHLEYNKALEEGGLLIVDLLPTIQEILWNNGYETISRNQGVCGESVGLDRGFIDYRYTSADFNTAIDQVNQTIMNIRNKSFIFFHHEFLHYPYRISDIDLNSSNMMSQIGISSTGFELNITEDDIIDFSYGPSLKYRFVDYSQDFQNIYELNNSINAYEIALDNGSIINWSHSDITVLRNRYINQISKVDSGLDPLFRILELTSLKDSIIVFYSTHGEGLFDNGIPNHGVSFQSNVHIPLFIKHPKIKSSIRIKEPVSLVDLVPTILDFLEIDKPDTMQGESFASLIHNRPHEREYIYGNDMNHKYIRHDNWKLIILNNNEKLLYDLNLDPLENNDVSKSNPTIILELNNAMLKHQFDNLILSNKLYEIFNFNSEDVRDKNISYIKKTLRTRNDSKEILSIINETDYLKLDESCIDIDIGITSLQDLEDLSSLAWIKFRNGKYQDSVNLFCGIIKVIPTVAAYQGLSSNYIMLKQYEKSKFYSQKAIYLDLDDICHVYTNLGLAEFHLNNISEAKNNYMKSENAEPNCNPGTEALKRFIMLADS